MIWTQINEFEIYNSVEIIKESFKTVLRIFLRTCETVSRKPCINRESKSRSSQFSYAVIVVTRTLSS